MECRRDKSIRTLAQLGRRLERFGREEVSVSVTDRACRLNPWFTPPSVYAAVKALRDEMLSEEALAGWLADYPNCPVTNKRKRNVAVIMPGNIPAVGFFDLLCVLVSGHACHVKPSSRDTPIMEYIIHELLSIDSGLPVSYLRTSGSRPDALIASGSDSTLSVLGLRYGDIPSVLRGSRSSAALLTGDETEEETELLSRDIFMHSGLGCRNVSMLLVPAGYDVTELAVRLGRYAPTVSAGYMNNYRQVGAMCAMTGQRVVDGGFFVLTPSNAFPRSPSRINYMVYDDMRAVHAWLHDNDDSIQCVVSRLPVFPRHAGFGSAQSPTLCDWPDGIDLLEFLCGLD